MKKRTVLLISGGGTTAEAVIKAVQQGKIDQVEIVGVIASRNDAPGIAKAQLLGIRTFALENEVVKSQAKLAENLHTLFQFLQPDIISQNGWLPHTPVTVVRSYAGKIINQHPGPLDPGRSDFGGKGMYGIRVTCARVAFAWLTGEQNPWIEATTHIVTAEYDQGNLLRVIKLPFASVRKTPSPADILAQSEKLREISCQLQSQLLPLEHENVIKTIKMLIQEPQTTGFKRTQPLISSRYLHLLQPAKDIAIQLFPAGYL